MDINIGTILGAFALVGVIIGWGYFLNNIRRDGLRNVERIEAVEKAEKECLIGKVSTDLLSALKDVEWLRQRDAEIWSIVSSDTRSRREDLWSHQSPLKLTEKAIKQIPENIKKAIDDAPGAHSDGITMVRSLALSEDELVMLARQRKWTVSELIFVVNDYIHMKALGGQNE